MTATGQVLVIRAAAPVPSYRAKTAAVHPDRRSRGGDGASMRRRARLDRAGIPACHEVDGPHDRDLTCRRPGAPRRPMSHRPGAPRGPMMFRRFGAPRRPTVSEVGGLHDRGLVDRLGAPRRTIRMEVDGPHDRDLAFRAGAARRPMVLFPERSLPRSRWRVPMRP